MGLSSSNGTPLPELGDCSADILLNNFSGGSLALDISVVDALGCFTGDAKSLSTNHLWSVMSSAGAKTFAEQLLRAYESLTVIPVIPSIFFSTSLSR